MESMADSVDSGDTGAGGLLSSLLPVLFRLGTFVLGLTVVAGGVLYAKQESLLYFPEMAGGNIPRRPSDNPRGYRSPAERQLPFESHRIRCADGVYIHAWLILAHADPSKAQSAPTIVFFHGNAGNIGLRLPNAVQMRQHLNANVLMVEYRGYGHSDDAPVTESGLRLDAEAALQFVLQQSQIDPTQIFLFGRSLGGSVALHLAEYAVRHGLPLAGVVVENTFTSISAMVDHLMPFLSPIKALVLKIGWDSERIVPHLKTVPLLFLAGARDELVPPQHMMRLVQLAEQSNNPLVRLHVIPDGTHNESWLQGGPAYWDAFRHFMAAAATADGRSSPLATSATTSNHQAAANEETTTSSSSIPIMSSRFVDIAKEAAGLPTTAQAQPNNKNAKKEL